MHQSNPSRPHISLRFGSILPAMFRLLPIWSILTIGIFDALSQQTVVVDPSKEKKAWTITWSEGPVSLTEVWIETTQDTRRLGTFPGESRGLEWNPAGDRLYYREKPLETKMIGIPLMERRSYPLSPPRVWELRVDQGSIRIVQESSASVSGGGTTKAYNTGTSDAASQEIMVALQALGNAFQASAMAYTALHQWDFEAASKKYRRAASAFVALRRQHETIGFFAEPIDAYVRELERRAAEARRDGARWVCRDHLRIVGDLFRTYAQAHDGRRPETFSLLKSWARGANFR